MGVIGRLDDRQHSPDRPDPGLASLGPDPVRAVVIDEGDPLSDRQSSAALARCAPASHRVSSAWCGLRSGTRRRSPRAVVGPARTPRSRLARSRLACQVRRTRALDRSVSPEQSILAATGAERRGVRAVPTVLVQHHPNRALANLRRSRTLRRVVTLARSGAVGKPGAVQVDRLT